MNDSRAAYSEAKKILRRSAHELKFSDIAYKLYLATLLGGLPTIIVVRSILTNLNIPPDLRGGSDLLGAAIFCALGAMQLGAHFAALRFGPIIAPEAYLSLIVQSGLPQRVTLLGLYRRSQILVASLCLEIGIVAVLIAQFGGRIDIVGVTTFLVGCLSIGCIISGYWLLTQFSSRGAKILAWATSIWTVVCAGVVLVQSGSSDILWSHPIGWVAISSRDIGTMPSRSSIIALVLLIGLAGIMDLMRRSLDRLHLIDLERQARRWTGIAAMALGGDLKSVSALLKDPPNCGRSWGWEFLSKGRYLMVAKRDLLGVARFPLRGLFWAVISSIFGYLWMTVNEDLQNFPIIVICIQVALYLSVGSFADGLRTYETSIGSPSPFGLGIRTHAYAHLAIPAACAFTATMAGALCFIVTTGGQCWPHLFWLLGILIFVVLAQGFSILKGLIPISMMTAVMGPGGGFSLIVNALWHADAILLVILGLGGLSVWAVGDSFSVMASAMLLLAEVLLFVLVDRRLVSRLNA